MITPSTITSESGHSITMSSGVSTATRALLQPMPVLQQDILRVLLYFDIFGHPLKAEEIYAFLPSDSTSPDGVARACQSDPLVALVGQRDDHFFVGQGNGRCTEERRRKEQLARRRWRIAFVMAKFIKVFPFVRAVFVSGELSKGVASRKGDIDYVIVTKANRLWICRTLLIMFKKVFLLNSKKYFCLNHFVSEDHLDFDVRNLYSAIEIATLKPLANSALFGAYIAANSWILEFLPNWKVEAPPRGNSTDTGSALQRVLEYLFPARIADGFDTLLMNRWQEMWKRRYASLSDDKRERLYRCQKHLSTAYGEDFLRKILDAYQVRLVRFGLLGDARLPNSIGHMSAHHD